MRDTRLIQAREFLTEAAFVNEQQVRGLIREAQKLIAELCDENVRDLHDRVDLMQTAQFLSKAESTAATVNRLVDSARVELRQMEERG